VTDRFVMDSSRSADGQGHGTQSDEFSCELMRSHPWEGACELMGKIFWSPYPPPPRPQPPTPTKPGEGSDFFLLHLQVLLPLVSPSVFL